MDRRASTRLEADILAAPIDLPCGRRVRNCLVKAAMYEGMTPFGGGVPNDAHLALYSQWAQGNWGIIITGNVQVAKDHLTLGRDLILPESLDDHDILPYKQLASVILTRTSTTSRLPPISLLQLNHSGRQSPRIIGGRGLWRPPVGASDTPLSPPDGLLSRLIFSLLFSKPIPLKDDDIEGIIDRFVFGANLAQKSGFDGVQIHCSHGYLLAQFLSQKTNNRPPPYGPPTQLHLLHTIVSKIRASVPPHFVLTIKLNAADYVNGGLSEADALGHVKEIAQWGGRGKSRSGVGIDIIEISGGDYERPDFMAQASPRQTFFASFSRKALAAMEGVPNAPKIMLTGSLRTRSLIASTITNSHAHFVGIGRPSVSHPHLPLTLLDPSLENEAAFPAAPAVPDPRWGQYVRLIGAGIGTSWWVSKMGRSVRGLEQEDIGAIQGIVEALSGGPIVYKLRRGVLPFVFAALAVWIFGLRSFFRNLLGM